MICILHLYLLSPNSLHYSFLVLFIHLQWSLYSGQGWLDRLFILGTNCESTLDWMVSVVWWVVVNENWHMGKIRGFFAFCALGYNIRISHSYLFNHGTLSTFRPHSIINFLPDWCGRCVSHCTVHGSKPLDGLYTFLSYPETQEYFINDLSTYTWVTL